ncbi:MAG: hypothetical protein ACJ8AD_07715 [Gemmatimonadaceae bacterium]
MNEHANEHGISQLSPSTTPGAVDRRRFLTQLGNAGMLGAAFLTLGDRPDALWRILGGHAGAARGGAADRPIYMVCLGDSIMWGQGLADGQKFQALVANWIQSNNPARRQIRRWNFAHSGAGFGPNPVTVIGRPTVASLGRQLAANQGDRSRLPDFDFIPASRGGTQGVTTAIRQEGSAGDRLGGEIPRTFPTLWRQLDLAVETLRTGHDARGIEKSGILPPAQPEEVELVLMDGGANDVGFLDVVLDPSRTADQVRERVTSTIRPGIQAFLPAVLKTFPNATVVVTGYYRGLSEASLHAQVALLIEQAARWGLANGALHIPQDKTALEVRAAIGRMAAFDDSSNAVFRDVVTQLGQGRTLFASPEFAPENAYGAPQRFVFHLTDTDPAEVVRRAECDKLLGEWLQGTFITGQTSPVDTPWHLFCLDASTFHPNPAGARRYADKIVAVLQQQRPAWLAPVVVAGGGGGTTGPVATRAMRVTVKGTTAGTNKTVIVTAVDAATGQPVDGTVSIGGATGKTGSPVTFSCETDRELAVGPRVVRRPLAACTGSVHAEGYRDAPIRY